VIELKCESLWQQAAPGTFLSARFAADIAKRAMLLPPAPNFMAFAVTATAQCFASDMAPATPYTAAGALNHLAARVSTVIPSDGHDFKIGIFRYT
jgi:hypothetical protein